MTLTEKTISDFHILFDLLNIAIAEAARRNGTKTPWACGPRSPDKFIRQKGMNSLSMNDPESSPRNVRRGDTRIVRWGCTPAVLPGETKSKTKEYMFLLTIVICFVFSMSPTNNLILVVTALRCLPPGAADEINSLIRLMTSG